MNDFLKIGKLLNNRDFTKTFTPEKRTVCIRYMDGKVAEHPNITEPWKYIVKIKKVVNVVDAWIKDE